MNNEPAPHQDKWTSRQWQGYKTWKRDGRFLLLGVAMHLNGDDDGKVRHYECGVTERRKDIGKLAASAERHPMSNIRLALQMPSHPHQDRCTGWTISGRHGVVGIFTLTHAKHQAGTMCLPMLGVHHRHPNSRSQWNDTPLARPGDTCLG